MKPRLFAAASVLALCCASWSNHAGATAILSVDAIPPIVTAGDSLIVNINISNVSDLYGFQFDLGFNPAVLAAGASLEGTFLSNGGASFFIPGANDNVGGSVSAVADTLLTAISGTNGAGILASIDFTAIASGSSDLTLMNIILLDSLLNPISDFSSVGGSVAAQSAVSVPEPTTLSLLGIAALVVGATFVRRNAPRCGGRQ